MMTHMWLMGTLDNEPSWSFTDEDGRDKMTRGELVDGEAVMEGVIVMSEEGFRGVGDNEAG